MMTQASVTAEPGGNPARQARAIAITALCLLLAARVFYAYASDAPGQLPFVVALFVMPLLSAIPSTQPLLARHRWLVLAVQAVLTCVPFAIYGAQWAQGLTGLLAGLVLLLIQGWVSWLLAGSLLVADVVIRAGVTGLPWTPAWTAILWVVIVTVDDGLPYFGLVRLADLVTELHSARGQVADLAVARERLHAADDLQAAIGERLAGIAAMAAAARQALPGDPETARAQVESAGATAREAVARARAMTAQQRGAPAPEPAAAGTGAAIAPRLAWAILVVLLCAFFLDTVDNLHPAHIGPGAEAALFAGLAVGVAVLQLYHSRSAMKGGRPRLWPLTLAIQTALVYVPFVFHQGLLGAMVGFAAGSFLLLVPGWWRWAGYAAVVSSWCALYATVPQAQPPQPGITTVLYTVVAVAFTGLAVYGLTWLARAARQLAALQGELARTAVVQERLRVARDVHDLLGLGLSAIALKADLIGRLIGRDNARAAAEIAEMGRICAHARADIRLVTQAGGQLPLDAELAAAREILASAGVDVRAEIDAGPLPAAPSAALAPVLREAVTNILRHSAATACIIDASVTGDVVRLQVSNDGAAQAAASADGHAGQPLGGEHTGTGLANLTARVRAAGGRLDISHADDWFRLSAEVPL